MSKWRPANNCTYVIPDIHGRADELNVILKRILPLRNNKNGKDQIIFLGDYVDRGAKSPEVIDILINLKTQYQDQIILLRGNHEDLVLRASGLLPVWDDPYRPSAYSTWLNNGGVDTLRSYARIAGIEVDDHRILTQDRNIALLNKDHLDFLLNETKLYHETEDHIFVHAGVNYQLPLSENTEDILLWDRSMYSHIRKSYYDAVFPWEKTIVCGHSHDGPLIRKKYYMLDALKHSKLFVMEMVSTEMFFVGNDNTKLTKY